MRIGELAAQVHVNPKTIRYYESIGLLPEPARTAAGHRIYGPDDVERLAFVRRAADLELTLEEIAEVLALRDEGRPPCDYVVSVARTRVAELDGRIEELRTARDELEQLVGEGVPDDQPADCFCHLIETTKATT